FNLEVEVEEESEQAAAVAPDASMPFAVAPEIHAKGLDDEHRQQPLQYSAPTLDGGGAAVSADPAPAAAEYAGTPRNAPCPCGSGAKYKKCHGAPGRS
ncbi:MAG: SEC-C metal-binding domain-containing protein, partial [Actinomycetes bacterium]